MTPKDLAELHAVVFTVPRPFREAEFEALLRAPSVFLVTESNAFLLGRVIAGEAELLTLAVDPEMRRRGKGARMVQGFHDEALARKAATAFLEVDERNHGARALYLSKGYSQAGRRRRYYRHADGMSDALVLRKTLRAAD